MFKGVLPPTDYLDEFEIVCTCDASPFSFPLLLLFGESVSFRSLDLLVYCLACDFFSADLLGDVSEDISSCCRRADILGDF